MNFSITYLAQLAQFLSFGLALANIQIDPSSLETTLSVVATLVSGIIILIRRYKMGGVTILGTRSK